jgi:hypothetical protein
MADCFQNLTLRALSSRSALSVLFGVLFKMFRLFFNTAVLFCITKTLKISQNPYF